MSASTAVVRVRSRRCLSMVFARFAAFFQSSSSLTLFVTRIGDQQTNGRPCREVPPPAQTVSVGNPRVHDSHFVIPSRSETEVFRATSWPIICRALHASTETSLLSGTSSSNQRITRRQTIDGMPRTSASQASGRTDEQALESCRPSFDSHDLLVLSHMKRITLVKWRCTASSTTCLTSGALVNGGDGSESCLASLCMDG